MSDYTKEEIEEMRKRLPFKAVVWDNEDNTYSKIVAHIFDDGRCATSVDTWMCFKEVKDPKYVPFTAKDFKDFAGKWIVHPNGSIEMIVGYTMNFVQTTNYYLSFIEAGSEWKFQDSGKPFGKEV